ncbi:MAG: sugar phosphate isomerase/epimerase family protein [Anaerolineae bacterium]
MAKKKISVGTWAYIWGGYADKPIPLPTVVKRLAELKFDGIEFGAFDPHYGPADYTNREKRLEIKKMLDDHGLGISGIAGAFAGVPALINPNDYLDQVKRQIEICLDMNIPKLRVDTNAPPTGIPGGLDYETCFWRYADVWHRAAEVCARHGIKLVWEFEPGFFLNKPGEVVRMCYAVDHPNFGVLFDSCHAYMCSVIGSRQLGEKETLPGGVVQFAHMLTGKIHHVHFIDSDGTLHDNETSTHAPFGKGVLDFPAIVKALQEAGYTDEWWPIDLCFWEGALEATPPTKAFMDELVERYG